MLVFGTPIILAGLGGVMCENAGVVNIALEGIMRFGGFFAVFGSYISSKVIDPITGARNPLAGNPWIGILFAIFVGVFGRPSSWLYIYLIKRKPNCFCSCYKCFFSWRYDIFP